MGSTMNTRLRGSIGTASLLFPLAVLFSCSRSSAPGTPSEGIPDLPGIVRQERNVYLMENHNSSYVVWKALGVTNATVVHLDTHDDSRYCAPDKLAELDALAKDRQFEQIHRRSDLWPTFRFETHPTNQLFNLGSFVYPCLADGTIATFYWVVPDTELTPRGRNRIYSHLAGSLRLGENTRVSPACGSGFSFPCRGARYVVTTLDNLPTLPDGALVDFDIDFFAFPTAMGSKHLNGKLQHDPADVCALLRERVPDPSVVTVSSSIWFGYLPAILRFVPDGCFDFFADGRYPEYPQTLLRLVTDLRINPRTRPYPAAPTSETYEPAYHHVCGLLDLLRGESEAAGRKFFLAAGQSEAYCRGLLDAAESFTNMKQFGLAHTAVDQFEKLTGGPSTQSLVVRTKICLATGALDRADKLSKRLVDWSRELLFLNLRAVTLTQLGRSREAERIYRELIAGMPGHCGNWYNLGVALERQGRVSEARQAYTKALELEPGLTAAKNALRRTGGRGDSK